MACIQRSLGFLRSPVINGLRLQARTQSSTSALFEKSPIQVSVTDDGQTIVCYHAEPSFPYEHSRPIIEEVDEKHREMVDSVLKTDLVKETDDILYNKDFTTEQLMQMTYTAKYAWFTNNRWKRRRFTPPKPRAGI